VAPFAARTALQRDDLRAAALVHLVDADHRVHRHVQAVHAVELVAQLLLAGIDDDLGLAAPHEVGDLDEAEQHALPDLARVELEDAALVEKADAVELLVRYLRDLRHGRVYGRRTTD
jgi:hypothetical protein